MLACMVVLKCRVCDATAGYLRCSIKTVDLYNLAFVWWRKEWDIITLPNWLCNACLLPLLCFWRTPSQPECAMHPIECCNAWFAPETCSSSHYKRDAFFFAFLFFFLVKKIGANAYGYDEDSTVSDSCYGWTWRHLLIWRSILNLTAAASRRTGNLSLSFSFWENGQHMHSSLSTSVKPLGLWTTSLAIPSGPWLSVMHPPFTVLPFYCPGMLMHARIFVWTLYGA